MDDPERECVDLVRWAVEWWRPHRKVIGKSHEWRMAHPEFDRLPELDLREWYARADAAIRRIDEH